MKQLSAIILFLFISITCLAQYNEQINYQGVARNAQGQPYANQAIAVRLTILDLTANSAVLYRETRNVITNAFGLFTAVINSGGASSQTGLFSAIDWNKPTSLQTEIDPAGGSNFVSIGITQIQSVPHSLMTKKLKFPYAEENNSSGTLFYLVNRGTGGGIYSYSEGYHGITGATNSGNFHAGVRGYGLGTGSSGVRGSADNAAGVGVDAVNQSGGLALNVFGGLKISGGNTSPGAGKVLTSDASGNATWQSPVVANKVAFYASDPAQGGLQNLPNATWYKLHCAVEEYDPGNDYTLYTGSPSSTFTAPVAGVYQFQAGASTNAYGTNIDLGMRMQLKRNGANEVVADNYVTGNDNDSYTLVADLSRTIYLKAGDQVWVELRGETSNGVNPVLINKRTYFTGFLSH